jgi:cystathionine beta-lyase/cystathionine gamma-synthase
MNSSKLETLKQVLAHVPSDWINLTTHRLDIYDESQAKTQFLAEFEKLVNNNNISQDTLNALPTAFDYIRLGHPLSCVLEGALADQYQLQADNVVCFSSNAMPILAVLRKNAIEGKATRIVYTSELPKNLDLDNLKTVYGYNVETVQVNNLKDAPEFNGSTIFYSQEDCFEPSSALSEDVDFWVQEFHHLGSIILVNPENSSYVSEIQHVRRRESIAMTPANCLIALEQVLDVSIKHEPLHNRNKDLATVVKTIQNITLSHTNALVASSGLSIQYAITMGLIEYVLQNNPGKDIKIIVPPNCYGGTNDQARRVAACVANAEVLDLPVDAGHDMVDSVNTVLGQVAKQDAVALIIVEIPTNPRVEVPELIKLEKALSASRMTSEGKKAEAPIFILDQTFCPNYHFLGDDNILANVQTISYVSGSKFPSGGKCTAGYCVANNKAAHLMPSIEKHLNLCDNQATDLQLEILAQQMPSMVERIAKAYKNTREFVSYIEQTLPDAKINFVPQELAEQGFTPSVFSLDLPTKGSTDEEREAYKRELNHKLIGMMINQIPTESKYCVSYGQLKGCYWTIPATSTQGTTKEGDKDYIARVAVSPYLDLEKHKAVFKEFVEGL